MNIARVFPRRTKATPTDALAFVGLPPKILNHDDIDEVHVSVAFTYDKDEGEMLAYQWEELGKPVYIGGPAYGKIGGEFLPNMYLKEGYTITSRGCSNNCWFCFVPKRQGGLSELEIKDGWILQDDNILGCSEDHIRKVFEMLGRQKERPVLSGGLEAKIMKPWHVELLQKVKPKEMFFAYDTPDDYEPLYRAGQMLNEAGFTLKSRKSFCYVLIGYKNDTFEKAEKRLIDTLKAGFIPFGMLYKDEYGNENTGWKDFQRMWTRPAIIVSRNKEMFK